MIEYKKKGKYNINDLLEIMKILRSDDGCPWDKEQNHKSIRSNMLEEAYEAAEAIDIDDPALLCEELGDVLLQVVFHCRIEEESGIFDFDSVCDGICRKLIIRHPHVFGQTNVSDTEEVLSNWDKIKREEKQQSYAQTLRDIPKAMPALMRAQKIGKRAKRAGMDFENTSDALACIPAEYKELCDAVESGVKDDISSEFGDLLFSCVNAARHLGIDAEEALIRASQKFTDRFGRTENAVAADGLDMKELSISQLDEYWKRIKDICD